jgi:hypothetical protein
MLGKTKRTWNLMEEDTMPHMPGYVWALAVSAAIGIPGMTAVMPGSPRC